MSRRNRLADLLKQLPLSVGFLCLAGAVTYIIIMLLGWGVDLSGATGMTHTVLRGVAITVGLVLFMLASVLYMQKVGANDADFVCSNVQNKAEIKPYMAGASILFVISLVVYGALLGIMSLAEWGFFSGPAAYIAAALNFRWGTPLEGVRLWCSAVGYAFTAAALFPAMLEGYKKGFVLKTEK